MDSLTFFVSKYLVSKNRCPLSGDCESPTKKGLFGLIGGLLASDTKFIIWKLSLGLQSSSCCKCEL